MRRLAAPLIALALAAGVAAQKPGDPSPEPPPPEPISLAIIGKRKVTIDRMGQTAEGYRKGVQGGTIMPPPASCSLALKITNHTKETIRVRVTGTAPVLSLTLEGKAGSVTRSDRSRPRMAITYAELKPGASHMIDLEELAGYTGTKVTHPAPLGEGEYVLTATYRTYIYAGEAPAKGGKGKGVVGKPALGKNPHTLKSAPFKITVKAK